VLWTDLAAVLVALGTEELVHFLLTFTATTEFKGKHAQRNSMSTPLLTNNASCASSATKELSSQACCRRKTCNEENKLAMSFSAAHS
jgi:hypothetical protein